MKERILEIIAAQFTMDVASLNPKMDFRDDLNADSIDLVELIMTMEDEFGIQVSDDDIKKLNTIEDVIDYVEELEIEN
ncbi:MULTISPECIES: acyl carrier protein [Peptoniphilus]|uniref:acyl carrier protein n=1 Tax=Peptoniphilus TaxID=162289 RepID=UPI0003B925B5|nr:MULTISPECIES: acyl carrier protein [Peptoniphilus]ERT63423.1 acyl carrier protein [Peptoniphilus sp. BV3AC2]MDK8275931.1 acyl carrier protein [Peptoniphilus duerdenii]